ncbi:energy-coupling factor ABC transporter ATP-binding protein [Sporosarcina sp. NPDC096371]|uniref:energy-coupling factor ABC transporter ATP-binding protein n=1 Tax=Sporosarcina sp. NPDC096371 TaxID=3364530 RepID=UPI0037F8AE0E
MAFLQLKDVSYSYPNGFQAVQHINMEFELGESVAIIGQNGAGKTTTVKLMNALLKPTSGEVLINGESTSKFTTAQVSKKVGYVFQNPDDQIFHSDIYSEIAFGPKNQKLSASEVRERSLKAAEICGLTNWLEEHPYNLPYAMRKFITIAAIIAMDTAIIILDEPTAGQDRPATKRLVEIIDYLTTQGKTVITITHDMEFVANNFNRVIVMAQKQVLSDANAREVFWDHALLRKSHLKQPYISQLAHSLNLTEQIITIDEMTSALKRRIRS